MTMETLVRTSGLSRHYYRGRHEVRALENIDIDVARGEMLAVVGASGSGKSTLLNLLAGLDTPTSGVIEIAGTSLTSMSRRGIAEFRARRIGMIFQSFNLLPHLNACRNVELALYFSDYDNRDRRRRAAAMLERLGLGDRLDHVPGELSGGEQQRVAIARALVKEPEILCADEPTGNLDRENTVQIGKILSECNQSGVTVIMATHDLGLASDYCHRSVELRYGALTVRRGHDLSRFAFDGAAQSAAHEAADIPDRYRRGHRHCGLCRIAFVWGGQPEIRHRAIRKPRLVHDNDRLSACRKQRRRYDRSRGPR